MTRIAVVILNYNGEKLLSQFLPSVIQHSPGADIIIADNGSTDASLSLLRNQFSQVSVIALEENYGFCGGYNRALQQVQADLYVLLNSDVEVTANWLTPIVALFERDASIAAAQPKILSYHQKNKFEYAGAAGGFIDAYGYPFCRGRVFDYAEEDHHQYDDNREIFWATGACLFIRASVYHQFNGLDEDLFAHMEEIDLCWKINRAGLKVHYCGGSTVYHLGAGTLGYESPRKTYLNFRNNLILCFKHWDTGELWYKLPLRFILDWVAACMFLLKGKFSNAVSVVRAHVHFMLALDNHIGKRKNIRKKYPRYRKSMIYPGLIIIDFFLRGKRSIQIPSNPR
jgi:GT2 family glycosyltransferase